jgi:hypothetical protein
MLRFNLHSQHTITGMGNGITCATKTKNLGYAELRESIPGSLVSDQDFDLFYSLSKIESARTISTLLNPSPSQLFFVVISGEVHVHLTNPEITNKSAVATMYSEGETIHFFNTSTVASFDHGECPHTGGGGVKLSFHFKNSQTSVARVIGMDFVALDKFLSFAKSSSAETHALRAFLALTITKLPQNSQFFRSLSADQVN